MRVTFAHEGIEKVPGHFLEKNSVHWDSGPIPLIWDFQTEKLLGTASELRREENGELTAEIDVDTLDANARALFSDCGTTFFGQIDKDGWTQEDDTGLQRISDVKVRALVMSPNMPWRNPPIDGSATDVETEIENDSASAASTEAG